MLKMISTGKNIWYRLFPPELDMTANVEKAIQVQMYPKCVICSESYSLSTFEGD